MTMGCASLAVVVSGCARWYVEWWWEGGGSMCEAENASLSVIYVLEIKAFVFGVYAVMLQPIPQHFDPMLQ